VSRPKPQLPPTRRAVSDVLRSALGGDAHVRAYYDQHDRFVVAVLEAAHTPSPSLATYATASLHAVPNEMDGQDIRVELLMVAQEGEDAAANVVATAAFCVIKDGWLAAPGVVFPNAVREYFPETTVPHLMWTEPFDFADLSTITVDGMDATVHVLQAVPLTEAELALFTNAASTRCPAVLSPRGPSTSTFSEIRCAEATGGPHSHAAYG
jgi:hypothetical protein